MQTYGWMGTVTQDWVDTFDPGTDPNTPRWMITMAPDEAEARRRSLPTRANGQGAIQRMAFAADVERAALVRPAVAVECLGKGREGKYAPLASGQPS